MTKYSLYSVPALSGGLPAALSIITTQKQPSGWPIPLLRQLACSIGLALRQASPVSLPAGKLSVRLTVRQRAVLRSVARGMTDRQISLELHISPETVRYHKKNLYRLLAAENAVQMAVTALRLGLLPLDGAEAGALPCQKR